MHVLMCFTDYTGPKDIQTYKPNHLTPWLGIRKPKNKKNSNEKFLGKTGKTNK